MALPFLPPSEIGPIFQKLKSDARGAGLNRFVGVLEWKVQFGLQPPGPSTTTSMAGTQLS